MTSSINTNASNAPVVETGAPSRRQPSGGAPRRRKGEGLGRTFAGWLIVVGLAGGAVVGGQYIVEQRQKPPTTMALTSAVLSADGIPVGIADTSVVLTTEVAPGDHVREGQLLATVELDGAGRNLNVPEGPQEIVAPTDAIVVSVDQQAGSVAAAGEPVVTLYAPDDLAFTASVGVEQLEFLNVGMTGTVQGPAGSEPIPVKVEGLAPELGSDADLGNLDLRLVPVDVTDVAGLVPGLPFQATIDLTSAPTGSGPVVDPDA